MSLIIKQARRRVHLTATCLCLHLATTTTTITPYSKYRENNRKCASHDSRNNQQSAQGVGARGDNLYVTQVHKHTHTHVHQSVKWKNGSYRTVSHMLTFESNQFYTRFNLHARSKHARKRKQTR